eukprot:6200815-Pleurochrysis_carterae.AAC.1
MMKEHCALSSLVPKQERSCDGRTWCFTRRRHTGRAQSAQRGCTLEGMEAHSGEDGGVGVESGVLLLHLVEW